MQLNSSQLKQSFEAFLDAFPEKLKLRNFLMLEMVYDIDRLDGDGLDDIILSMIKEFESNGRIIELLDKAIQNKSNNPLLKSARNSLTVPIIASAGDDPYKVCFVGEERAFINRKNLRDSLRSLVDSPIGGKRVLLVKGPPVSGKTYSVEMISYLYQTLQQFRLVRIDLNSHQESVKPDDLARRIIDRIGLPDTVMPVVGQEQDSRWIQSFCDRFELQMEEKRDIWWLVIDGFTKWKLSDFANELIHELSRRINLGVLKLRMVLLGYEGLPPDVEKNVISEEIESIEPRHLISFFVQIYEERKKPVVPEEISNKVAEVLRSVNPDNPRRVELINAAVVRVCKTI